MNYLKDDIIKLSWEDFEKYMIKIKEEVEKYIETNNLGIDLIVPILRGGGIPALYLANALKVIRILPYQFKYLNNEKKEIRLLDIGFKNLYNFNLNTPTILVVEGNHSTGHLAKTVIKDINLKCPNAKIIYVALAKDYFYKDSVSNIDFTTCGFYTNENRKLSEEICLKLRIKYKKVYIFPWELEDEEFAALNSIDFKYRNIL